MKSDKDQDKKAEQVKSETALTEEKILKDWEKQGIFQKTLLKDSPKGEYVFYEGPPTANGKPGIHHLEARSFKDVIPRYKTMRGYHVARKGGWDTHGLPVEIQVEKKLGLTSKKEVEKFGIEAFNIECKKSVWEYLDIWNKFTARIGYWVDQENPYVTYEKTYMESVWNILKTVSERKVDGKNLIYKDYKVLPWCPRCGTALSSHELAQGYEDVKDLSVYAAFEIVGKPSTFLLAWTTTPWTLPGNVGLAVHPEIEYTEVQSGEKVFILAKGLVQKVFPTGPEGLEGEIVREFKGSELVGLEYKPLYPFLKEKFENKDQESKQAFEKAYKVYPADFVTTTDGTGIVHTAVMYGQEDFDLGTKVGLPKFHLVNESGHFLDGMDFLSGRFVKEKSESGEDALAIDVIKDLAKRGLLFKKEKYAHSYPHCWRCKTPLIYYARDSWYIRMSSLRAELLKENEKINWEPDHIKEGRFGEWLREVKDWAISRERYWGTPLPFWQDKDGNYTFIGSVKELKSKIKKRNNFFLVRHGESESNLKGVINSDVTHHDPLSEKGRGQARAAGDMLISKNIDVIVTSPFMRAHETAEIIAKEIGFKGEIVKDPRLSEIKVGEWHGKTWAELEEEYGNVKNRFVKRIAPVETMENWDDARVRVCELAYELDAKYEGKNILIISHGGPLNVLALSSLGYSNLEIAEHYYDNTFVNAEVREIDWRNLPHNKSFEIDLHKPFIDEVELYDESGEKLTRAKEVLDVWFDSGAMPFAQVHYLADNKDKKESLAYPADFISEAVDQTRGWFYTLLAIGVLVQRGTPYKNAICLGHILDEHGKKMSKSLGNIVDPWVMMDKYGVDALRLWMYSVNRPGDSKNFDEKTVDEIVKKVFNLISNVFTFYDMFAASNAASHRNSTHVLDRFIIARLDQLFAEGTRNLDNLKVFEASRSIRDFVSDLSTWYIRRSRDRFKSDDAEDKQNALATTKYVLLNLAIYLAPFTPFYAESLYRKLRGEKESVHLECWLDESMQSVGGRFDLKGDGDSERLSHKRLRVKK